MNALNEARIPPTPAPFTDHSLNEQLAALDKAYHSNYLYVSKSMKLAIGRIGDLVALTPASKVDMLKVNEALSALEETMRKDLQVDRIGELTTTILD